MLRPCPTTPWRSCDYSTQPWRLPTATRSPNSAGSASRTSATKWSEWYLPKGQVQSHDTSSFTKSATLVATSRIRDSGLRSAVTPRANGPTLLIRWRTARKCSGGDARSSTGAQAMNRRSSPLPSRPSVRPRPATCRISSAQTSRAALERRAGLRRRRPRPAPTAAQRARQLARTPDRTGAHPTPADGTAST